jgi:hypothetical protein
MKKRQKYPSSSMSISDQAEKRKTCVHHRYTRRRPPEVDYGGQAEGTEKSGFPGTTLVKGAIEVRGF